MHKCPTCKVPLHGWEDECPSCGTKQVVSNTKKSYGGGQQAPGVNPMPFVIGIVLAGAALAFAMNGSWIGQVMRRGPAPTDPLGGVTQVQARQVIEQRISEGLTSVGAKGKFSWAVAGQPGNVNSPNPIELTVDTSLSDKNARHQIINPIKDYMERGKVTTLTMNDAKSHSTWTYTCALPAPSADDNADTMPPMETAPPPQQQQQQQPQPQQQQQQPQQEQQQQPQQQDENAFPEINRTP